MSKYFETLARLRTGPSTKGYAQGAESANHQGFPSQEGVHPSPKSIVLGDLPVAGKRRAFSKLLNALRELSSDSNPPVAVIAGVTSIEPVARIVFGLLTQAGNEGIKILVGEILDSQNMRVLTTRTPVDRPTASSLPLNRSERLGTGSLALSGCNPDEVLNSWFQSSGGTNDLGIIHARPVLDSADATLMAKAGAGLVLAVQPRVTTRNALQSAVERVEASGTRLLGIVLCEHTSRSPRWISKVFRGTSTSEKVQSTRM